MPGGRGRGAQDTAAGKTPPGQRHRAGASGLREQTHHSTLRDPGKVRAPQGSALGLRKVS